MSYYFSIIIPTYQRKDTIVSNLIALQNQQFNHRFEVICVVDGSTDGTQEALRSLNLFFPFRLIDKKNNGAGAARNAGAKIAKGKFLLFLDDDMEPDVNLLQEHFKSHQKGANIVIGHLPIHEDSPKSHLTEWVKFYYEERTLALTQQKDIGFLEFFAGQVSIQKKLFDTVGGFDEQFTIHGTYALEDIDLGYRLLATGKATFVFNPRAISLQRYDITPAQRLKRYEMTGFNHIYFLRKYPNTKEVLFGNMGKNNWAKRLFPVAKFCPLLLYVATWWVTKLALYFYHQSNNLNLIKRFDFWATKFNYWKGVIKAGGIPSSKKLRVLSYHSISEDKQDKVTGSYTVSPQTLAIQLKTLKKLGFHFITPNEFKHFLNKECLLPPKAILLTFDDGYKDFLQNALPILHKENIQPILFIVSGLIGGSNEWDIRYGARQRPLLNVDELIALVHRGVNLGAHSSTHAYLPQLDNEALRAEIAENVLNFKALNLPVPFTFAYPFGAYNKSVINWVKKTGLLAAFALDAKWLSSTANPFAIPRMMVRSYHTLPFFLTKIIFCGYFKQK